MTNDMVLDELILGLSDEGEMPGADDEMDAVEADEDGEVVASMDGEEEVEEEEEEGEEEEEVEEEEDFDTE